MKDEKDIKMCKIKKIFAGRKSAAVSTLFFSKGDKRENVASVGPPPVTIEDVDCTALGVVNCAPAQLHGARLTQAREAVRSMGRLVASCKAGAKGQLGFRRMEKKEQECR